MADSQTIKNNVLKLQTAKASPEDIENYVKLATSESDFKPVTAPIPEKSLEDKIIEYPSQSNSDSLPTMVGNLINPFPFKPTMQGFGEYAQGLKDNIIPNVPNLPAEFEKKRQLAEQAGLKARDTLLGQTGDVVSNVSEKAHQYLPKTLANAVSTLMGIGGGVLGTELSLVPMTPGENALSRAPGMAANAISRGTRWYQKEIANRNLQANPLIQRSRYESGQPRVGEVALDMKKDVADLATNNKDTMYKKSRLAIGALGDKITNKINEINAKGTYRPINQDLSSGEIQPKIGVKTQEIADAIEPVLYTTKRRAGEDSATYKNLLDLKSRFIRDNGEYMDFLTANQERIRLGKEIGKDFQKTTSAIPEETEAMRAMWSSLRNKIGQLSPELDDMLKLQHDLIDVNQSALPAAAKGYTSTPGGVVEAFKAPFRRMEVADFLGNTLPNQGANLGTTLGVGSYSAGKSKSKDVKDFIEKVRQMKQGKKQ